MFYKILLFMLVKNFYQHKQQNVIKQLYCKWDPILDFYGIYNCNFKSNGNAHISLLEHCASNGLMMVM